MIILASHTIVELDAPTRIYDFCIGLFPQLPSRKGVKKAIERGMILLNNEKVGTGKYVQQNDQIDLVDLEDTPPKSYDLDLDVHYEDELLALINKPAGIIVSGNQYRTIQNALMSNLFESNQPDALKWPRPVHRLDSPTQGLLMVAKTATALMQLGQQFEQRSIQKTYHAVVAGKPKSSGKIKSPIEDQEAFTKYKTIESCQSLNHGHVSLVELSPKTGRTHQLRIHMAQAGHPIIGDVLYGEEGNTLLHKGLFLASTALEFIHPATDSSHIAQMKVPTKFKKYMERESVRYDKYSDSKSNGTGI